MPAGVPYVHWKINDEVNLAEIDPAYLWGTVIETNKGPLDTPVFITNATQGKKIFNFNFEPFFANGGQSLVVMRAYATDGTFGPSYSTFDFLLDQKFSYIYVDYDYYNEGDEYPKATIKLATTAEEETAVERPAVDPEGTEFNVAFFQGRWRLCDENGEINYYYKDGKNTIQQAVKLVDTAITPNKVGYFPAGTVAYDDETVLSQAVLFTKAYNESDVTRIIVAKESTIDADTAVANITAKYPGDYEIPVSVQKDIRQGYRVSIKESDDYTIMLAGATTLSYITSRINERAENVYAKLTDEGKNLEKVFNQSLQLPPLATPGDVASGYADPSDLTAYTAHAQTYSLPIGTIFQKVKQDGNKYVLDEDGYTFELQQTVTYLADGSNGPWDNVAFRLPADKILNAHRDALDHLANVRLAGIFCMYGEDDLINVYANHVSTTEPQGMNSSEVCKWRALIVGANEKDRISDNPMDPGFNLCDKAIALDSSDILFLGQGLIDDGYIPETGVTAQDFDSAALPGQLLPYQCTQYIAGLRSKLSYEESIFGGQGRKRIRGVGNLEIAPLFDGESKLLWQPQSYIKLNEAGVLTFTKDYGHISLLDGVTTRQSPLEEDEEGVQNIVRYAKHAVHEVLQGYIGRNISGDLQSAMQSAVQTVLSNMAAHDGSLVELPNDGFSAYEVDVILTPKTNAQQVLAKAYVYLKITPIHALRQIEVELTVQ